MSVTPTPAGRKTRRERQAETRLQVIGAARQLFLDRGYHRTTLAAVVEAAGFTKGAVYSNFSSKAELAFEVVGEIERENIAELARVFQSATDPAQRSAVVTTWGQAVLRDTDTVRLRSELNLAAIDDPTLADAMRTKSRNLRAAVTAVLAGMDRQEDFLVDIELLSSVLVALAVGVGLLKLQDADYDLDAFVVIAGLLTGNAVARTPPASAT